MAEVLIFDGFDYYETAYITDTQNWSVTSGNVSIDSGAGRIGNGMKLVGSGVADTVTFSNIGSPSIACVFRASELEAKKIVSAKDGATVQFYWEWTATGHIVVRNGSGVILGSTPNALNVNEFYHVDLYATISNSATVSLYINGDLGKGFQVSGVNTKMTANSYINNIRVGDTSGSSTIEIHIDDFHVLNNAIHTGMRVVDTIYPNGEVSGWNQWSIVGTTAGVANSTYQSILETPPDNNESYVYTPNLGGVGLAFFVELDDIPIPSGGSGTIDVIAIRSLAAKGTEASRRYKIGWWGNPSGGSTNIHYGPEIEVELDYSYDSLLLTSIPGTLAGWGPETLNALRIGGRRTV